MQIPTAGRVTYAATINAPNPNVRRLIRAHHPTNAATAAYASTKRRKKRSAKRVLPTAIAKAAIAMPRRSAIPNPNARSRRLAKISQKCVRTANASTKKRTMSSVHRMIIAKAAIAANKIHAHRSPNVRHRILAPAAIKFAETANASTNRSAMITRRAAATA